MATDDERREVARRLREVQSYVIPGTKTEENPITGRIIGVACWYDLPDFQGLLGRLADLIEPSIDSDALLARTHKHCGERRARMPARPEFASAPDPPLFGRRRPRP